MKKFLSIICFLLFMIFTHDSCFAQDSIGKQIGQHTIYAEIFGNAGTAVIGYDYVVPFKNMHKISFNCGVFLGMPRSSRYTNIPEGVTCYENVGWDENAIISPQISYLYGRNHHLELGIGLTYNYLNILRWIDADDDYPPENYWHIPFRVGYRHQREKGGLFLKIAYTPIIIDPFKRESRNFIPIWGGVALGYTFKNKK